MLAYHTIYLANAGVPLLFSFYFSQALLILLIIVIEAYVIASKLNSFCFETLFACTVANIMSTLAGIILAMIGMVDPRKDVAYFLFDFMGENIFLSPFIAISLLIFMGFLISIAIEIPIGRLFFRDRKKDEVYRAFLRANIVSYIILSFIFFVMTLLLSGYV